MTGVLHPTSYCFRTVRCIVNGPKGTYNTFLRNSQAISGSYKLNCFTFVEGLLYSEGLEVLANFDYRFSVTLVSLWWLTQYD